MGTIGKHRQIKYSRFGLRADGDMREIPREPDEFTDKQQVKKYGEKKAQSKSDDSPQKV